jgi:hypothetical protein
MFFKSSNPPILPLSIVMFMSVACFSCGHDTLSDFEGDGDQAIIDTGANCKDSHASSARTVKVQEKKNSLLCLITFSAIRQCKTEVVEVESNPEPTCVATTQYCKVDEKGNPISEDYISTAGNDKYTGLIGGCINRPIKEVFATLVNFAAMKPDPVDRIIPTQRKDLEDPTKNMFYVIDVRNVKGSIIGDIKWDVQYRYSVTKGSYDKPRQVAVNYQRTWGSSFVEMIKGGYVLDKVNDNVTSFVMTQVIKTAQYSQGDMRRDLTTDLRKARTAQPLWANLPENGPVTQLDFSNLAN